MKKILVCFMLMFAFTTVALAQEQVAATKTKKTLSEHERRGIAEKNLIAWEKELANVSQVLKAQLKFPEDKKRIDDYVNNCKNFAGSSSSVIFLCYADISIVPGKDRTFGTGAPAAMLKEETKAYRQATLFLAKCYKDLTSKDYEFVFAAKPEKKQPTKKTVKK